MNAHQSEAALDEAGATEHDALAGDVGELVTLLVKAVRAHQMYAPDHPMHTRFLASLTDSFRELLAELGRLELVVEEAGLRWQEHVFSTGDGRETLAFLFFRDGIRSLTFTRGFEDEVGNFLELVRTARQVDRASDDMVTLLWECEFDCFQYRYQDRLAEGVAVPQAEQTPDGEFDPGILDMELEGLELTDEIAGETSSAEGQASPEAPEGVIDPTAFEQTLYFLGEAELARLRSEVENEWSRDLRAAVVAALFDRLEEPEVPERQRTILGILSDLVPVLLMRGDLEGVAIVLRELDGVIDAGVLGDEERRKAAHVGEELSDPAAVEQVVLAIRERSISADPEDLGLFFSRLRSPALPVLLGSAERVDDRPLRGLLEGAIDRIAGDRQAELIASLDSAEPAVVTAAARAAGRMKIEGARPKLLELATRPEESLRHAAVEALSAMPSVEVLGALQRALDDGSRDVRIAALEGLARLRHRPAHGALGKLLTTARVAEADLTEQVAYFETYATIAGDAGVALLAGILNARKLLGRRPPPQVRACAARALGVIGTPAVRDPLARASEDPDPVVRSAARRALGARAES